MGFIAFMMFFVPGVVFFVMLVAAPFAACDRIDRMKSEQERVDEELRSLAKRKRELVKIYDRAMESGDWKLIASTKTEIDKVNEMMREVCV